MKSPLLIVTLCLATAALAFAGDLTDAAKGAKSKRKKSTSKVLTNTDVKKSKGKIVETPNISPTAPEQQPTLTEKYEAQKAADKAASELRAKQQQLVADLEKELAAIEQQYYDENDLNRRDTVIVKKFNDVKAKLEAAKTNVGRASARP
jgi:hypothetical protein